jgi:hypothetical protein
MTTNAYFSAMAMGMSPMATDKGIALRAAITRKDPPLRQK